ncbi:MAG TPA: cell division protein ZipA [Thiopseudomonas sp.]|nr:cell division protein ZipA [Thiopseudomonas sp.]
MDIGLREWIVVIGIIVIVAILFDAWRRMSGNRSTLKFRLDRNLADTQDDENPEIVGPARVVKKQEPSIDGSAVADFDLHVDADQRLTHQDDLDADVLDETDTSPFLSAYEDAEEKPEEAYAAADPYNDILIINVESRSPDGFKGPALLQSILESGLRFGAMDIFHRHESMTGHGETLFSMANALNPGTFDLDDMDMFSTRAVCFFMALPGPRNSRQAFDLMIAAARKVAKELEGDLKDDHRSVLTAQTIEHYRQRIADFERRQLVNTL